MDDGTKEREELIEFVDNILEKSKDAEEFSKNLGIVYQYMQLKGVENPETLTFLKNLNDCANEIMSIKSKGIKISISGFFPKKTMQMYNDDVIEQPKGRHYASC